MKKQNNLNSAFTLIELLVVIAIIASVAVVVYTSLNPRTRLVQSKEVVNKTNIESIRKAVNLRYVDEPRAFADCDNGLPAMPTIMGSGDGYYDIAPCLIPKYFGDKLPVNPDGGFFNDINDYDTKYTIAEDPGSKLIRVEKSYFTGSIALTPPGVLPPLRGLAVRSDGSMYAITGNYVSIISPSGTVTSSFGGTGSGLGQFNGPWDIEIAPNGDVYVVDTGNNRIQKFNASGGSPSIFASSLNQPRGIAIDSAGGVYVTDSYNHLVKRYNSSGTLLSSFGTGGAGPGYLNFPSGIDVDQYGNMYIVDTTNNRQVQIFAPNNQFMFSFGFPDFYEETYWTLYHIDIGLDGKVRIADTVYSKILNFSPAGTFLSSFGSQGIENGQFGLIGGVDTGPDGRIYVSDIIYPNGDPDQRIQIFAPSEN